jgi:hypothetical protein
MGLIATLTALVLGLMISSAHSAYNAQSTEVQQPGVHIYQFDRILDQFGRMRPAALPAAQLRLTSDAPGAMVSSRIERRAVGGATRS